MDRLRSDIHKDWHRLCLKEERRCRGPNGGAAHARFMEDARRARFYYVCTRGL